MAKHISVADTNKIIRKQLDKLWPKTTFYVYKGGGHSSTNVRWQDGPSYDEVDQVMQHFHGLGPTDMTDYAPPRTARDLETGEEVRYGTDYIALDRYYSVTFLRGIVEKIAGDYGVPVPEVKMHKHWISASKTVDDAAFIEEVWSEKIGGGRDTLAQLVWREARKTSAVGVAAPKPLSQRRSDKPVATKTDGGWQIRHTDFEDGDLFRQYKATLGFYWNKFDKSDRFWWCPVEKLPDDIQALVDKVQAEINQRNLVYVPPAVIIELEDYPTTLLNKPTDEQQQPKIVHKPLQVDFEEALKAYQSATYGTVEQLREAAKNLRQAIAAQGQSQTK